MQVGEKKAEERSKNKFEICYILQIEDGKLKVKMK